MGAILLAVTGLDPHLGWERLPRTLAPRRDHPDLAAAARRPCRHLLCLRLAAAARPARRHSKSRAIFSLGAGVDHLLERSGAARRAGRAHRRSRPHHADDRIRRPARADASSPPAALRRPAARASLARARSAGGERGRGRHHGPRRARRRCRGGAAPARLSRCGMEPHAEAIRGHRDAFTARPASTPFCAAPKSWSACCRRRRRRPEFSGSSYFRKLRRDGARRRRLPDQCRPRRPSGRCRHPRRARRGIARGRHARCVRDRAAAGDRARCGRIPR